MKLAGEISGVYRFSMTASARIGLKIVAVLAATLGLVSVALLVIVQSSQFKNWIQAEISGRSGYAIQMASLNFRPPFTVIAHGVQISKASQTQFNSIKVTATLNPFDLGSKTLHRLALEKPVLQLDIDEIMKAPTQGAVEIALRDLNVQDGMIVLKKGVETVFELPKINLNAQNLNLGGQSGVSLRADVPQLNGQAELNVKGQPRDLQAEISIRPKPTQSFFSGRKAKDAPDETLHLYVKLRAPERQMAEATIDSKFNQLAIGDNKLTGTLDAQVAIDPGFTDATFTGKTTLADFPNSVSPVALQVANGTADANFAGTFSIPGKTLTVKTFQLTSPLGKGVGEGRATFGVEPTVSAAKLTLRDLPLEIFKTHLPAPLNRWSYQGQAQATLDLQGAWHALEISGTVQSDSMQVRGDGMAVANISVSAPFAWTKPVLRFKDAKIRARELAYAPKERWQAAAEKLQIDATFDYQAKQPLKLSGRVETAGAKFSSPDNAKIGEHLNLSGSFGLILNPEKSATSLNGRFTADSGELLWGKFFGDLKVQKPVLELDAAYIRDQDRLDCRRCNVIFASVGTIEVGGAIERVTETPVLHLQANSANFSPSGFFEFFLRETFNRQYPILNKLAVSGQMAFRLRLDGNPDALDAEGELSLKGGELRAQSNDWQIGPMALNLPLQVHLADAKASSSGTQRTGTLTIEKIRFANQTVAPIATTLSLSNNALRFHQPIRARIFGGDIEIGNLFWPDLLKNPKELSFSAEIKRLNLDDLTEAMNWPRFSGTLTGSIPQVQSVENTLSTRGEIQAELFGGRLRIGKLEIENLFSGLASLKLDARLDGIQLEQLSKTFAFGHISGILEGSIDDLILTNGQPSELRADLHSVDRGGEQRISVEALNKITVLSSGEDAGALYGGLATFFDSFRYSKLGFKATLKNDRLTLRGVESRGDQEYLVVGSFLPPTVNVVSHTQNIAFSELVRRLERINKSDKPNVK